MGRNSIAVIVVLLVASGCSPSPSTSVTTLAAVTATPAVTTTFGSTAAVAIVDESWPTSTPEQQGMSSTLLAGLFDAVVDAGYRVDGIVIVRHGHVITEATGPDYDLDEFHIVHSVTKSIISTLIGIAIDEDLLDGVDQRIVDIFGGREIENLDVRKKAMTLEHLLTMTTGFDCRDSYLYRWEGLHDLWGSDDWVQHILDLPMIAEPGERFEYCNSASFLLSAIVTEVTGVSAEEYALARLFEPIGVTEFHWPANPNGISIGWGELLIAPSDLARFGLLILNDGYWDGERIVPEAWIEEATRVHVEGTLQDGYGYQWWIRADGVIEALGYQGQYVIIDRGRDLVTVFTSTLPDEEFYVPDDFYDRYVIPAAVSTEPLPPEPEGNKSLRLAVEAYDDR